MLTCTWSLSRSAGIALKGYFAGKRKAEAALANDYAGSAVIIAPSFIYGGDAFVVNPPRVPAGYGGAIEGLLSNGAIRGLAGVMPGHQKAFKRLQTDLEGV